MSETIPEAVCLAAVDLVLAPLGISVRRLCPHEQIDAAEAMRRVLLAQRDHNLPLAREEISRVGDQIAEGV